MKKSSQSALLALGLTDGEAKVYLALLKEGSSTVGPIVKESKVAYSNIYEILDRLGEKGLVTFIIKSKTHFYQAVPPNRVKDYLAKKEEELAAQKQLLSELVPELELLQSLSKSSAEAEVFMGWKGLRSAHEKLVEKAKPRDEHLYFYSPPNESVDEVDRMFVSIEEIYREKKIMMRGLSHEQYKTAQSYTIQADYMKVKFVDFPIPAGVDICNDKILFSAWQTPLAVLVSSKELADSFRGVFEDIWKKAHN